MGFFLEEAPRPYLDFPGLKVGLGGPLEGAFHLFRARLDFAPWPDPSEAKPLLGHLPRVEHALKAKGWSLEAYRAWAEEEGLLEDEEPHPEKVLTFAELAALSEGAPYLGALMLDADRMGEAFATGFRREGRDLATPSRLAALSRTLEVFFTTEVLTLLEEPRRYRERLGWDDLEAQRKEARYPLLYSVYSGGTTSSSSGPGTPFWTSPWTWRGSTASSPATRGSPSPGVPPRPAEPPRARARPAFGGGGEAGQGRGAGEAFPLRPGGAVGDLAGPSRLGRGPAPRPAGRAGEPGPGLPLAPPLAQVLPLEDPGERMRYKPLLAYALRRVRERDEEAWKRYLKLLDHQDPAWAYLPVWVQWALYRERRV